MLILLPPFEFSIPDRYHEGSVLTRSEAQVLNGVLAERVREAARRTFESRRIDDFPSAMDFAELESWIRTFAFNFEFKPKAQTRPRSDTLQAEILQLAQQQVEELMKREGRTLTPVEFDRAVSAIASRTDIYAEAARRLRAKFDIARKSIEELL